MFEICEKYINSTLLLTIQVTKEHQGPREDQDLQDKKEKEVARLGLESQESLERKVVP